ncbi:hypothetical protein M8998_14765 [Sphingobacterium sp. lm-10]|uniref:hypothetical protein n=1 Tax=Sphingobacterium sp. lm-10 TaxID=2944904 RepID=UPI00202180D8|nr:hypothetical protein [Sphingobacterium sp. lm-10]MCL7989209.1 hypothetical protein [Sphingobacterium sp. lm-10]
MNLSYRVLLVLLFISFLFITGCTKKVIEPEPEPEIPTEPPPEPEDDEPDSVYYLFGEKKSVTKVKIEKGVSFNTLSDAEIAQYFAARIQLFTPATILVTNDSTIISTAETEDRYKSLWKNSDKDLYLLTGQDNQELLLGSIVEEGVLQIHISYSRQTRLLANRSLMVMEQHYGATPFDTKKHLNETSSHAYGVTEELLFREQN